MATKEKLTTRELMTGNVVQMEGDNYLFTVQAIDEKNQTVTLSTGRTVPIDQLIPVAFTASYATHLGFVFKWKSKEYSFYRHSSDMYHLSIDLPNDPVWSSVLRRNTSAVSDFRYVHTLQNLVQTVTGQELPFTH
jgi:hypothetical protein